MSIGRATLSAIGKLLIVVLIGAAFVAGFFYTLRASLYSPEVTVPNIVGKEVGAGESELEATGLNMRRRATRYSADVQPNTILDQSPRAGEIIKSGQTVAVVISRSTANEGESSVPVATETPDANANTSPNANTTAPNNANNQNANKNRNRNKNANNSNNSNNANNRNANNRNANNRNVNSNRNGNTGNSNRPVNNNNGGGNRNSNAPGNRNANSGNRNNSPARGNSNGPGRARIVNSTPH